MAKILILIGAHLCTAPRPQKEADTLAAAGHDVTVRGVWFDPELVKRDRALISTKSWRFEPVLDFQPHHRWQRFWTRFQTRFAREQFSRASIFSPHLLGYGSHAMLKAAQQARADLTIVHSEAGLWVGNQLLDRGFRVGVDFEDWFSEDLLPEARFSRPIAQLKALEARLIRACNYCLTTSKAMSKAMSVAYQAPEPTVVYNTFAWNERSHLDHQFKDRQQRDRVSLHWFSHTIGAGRGLETLFQALHQIDIPVEVHLRGNYPESSRQWLTKLVPNEWLDRTNPKTHHIWIHQTVPNDELLSRIAEHDIGLALETSTIPSRNLTITNKLFQYLQAGLAVIATNTQGQREVFKHYPEMGQIIPDNAPDRLAIALKELLTCPEKLQIAKSAALEACRTRFCWEHSADTLLNCCPFDTPSSVLVR